MNHPVNIHLTIYHVVNCKMISESFPDVEEQDMMTKLIRDQQLTQVLKETCKRCLGENTYYCIFKEGPGWIAQFDKVVQMCIDLLKQRGFVAEAFAFGVLIKFQHTDEKLKHTDNLRKLIARDVNKYEENLKVFEPILTSFYGKLKKPEFYYLDMMLETYLIQNFNEKVTEDMVGLTEQFGEQLDLQLSFIRKKYEVKYFPAGKTNYLFGIIYMSIKYLINHRFKQSRHLITVVATLMKTVDKNTKAFKNILDIFYMAKTLYLAKLLEVSEYYENFSKSPIFAAVAKELLPKDKVVDFGIELIHVEDPELPVELELDAAKRSKMYKKLHKYKNELMNSSLPHLPDIYNEIIKCTLKHKP